MSDLRTHPCPTCDGQIPNNETPGAYSGAISRKDNKTEICSACGTKEALADFFGVKEHQHTWGVDNLSDDHEVICLVCQVVKVEEVICPQCDEPTTKEALAQWEMCHDCDNQMCAECGQIDCDHEF
jgi:hypothetical protein